LAGNGDGKNSTAANNGTPAQPTPPTLPPKPPVDVDAPQAPAFTVPALTLPGSGDTAPNPGAANTQAQLTPQQELVQLDQTLQQLGVDPQSISLFNRMALLLFAQDPTALKNLVDALQTADKQLGQLAGLANPNVANAQIQPLVPTAQNVAQQLPPAQTPGQNAAVSGNSFDVVAAQLNFTEVQGTITTEAPANNANDSGAAQAVQTTTQFQELQLSFTALEIQGTQAASNNTTGANAQGQALNVKA
jgi:hypothetical protein